MGVDMKVDRRSALSLVGVSAFAAVGSKAQAEQLASEQLDVSFLHGVASGDPLQDRIILWTRVTPKEGFKGTIPVAWEIASDADFRHKVNSGVFNTNATRDFTVKIDASGLKPHTDYYYRFKVGNKFSPIGRTHTLPKGNVEDLVLVAASCALYSNGFFNAYKEISKMERVDLVLHLGDYIYEYGAGPNDYGMAVGSKIGRAPKPAHETISLEDYRERYACYRLDEDLQAAHARVPWICVWDDHETANDDWADGAENHQANEGDWKARAKASVLAYYEWIPIREPEKGKDPKEINRAFEIGNLATIIMMENRLVGRSRQLDLKNPNDATWNVIDNSDPKDPKIVTDGAKIREILTLAAQGNAIPTPYTVQLDHDSVRKSLADETRSVYGAAQEAWLKEQLEQSVKANKPWQIIGNEVVMANMLGTDIPAYLGADKTKQILSQMPPKYRAMAQELISLPKDIPLGFDGWDGYPAARSRVSQIFEETKSHPIVLSGDSHAFWINELKGNDGKLIAAELGTTSITSPSIGNMLGDTDIGPAFAATDNEIKYCNQMTHGYVVLKVTKNDANAELIGMSTVYSKDYKPFVLKNVEIKPELKQGIKKLSIS